MPEITRERVVYRGDRERDRDSDSDDRATGYRTVQRYRVTRSRVEPIEDERRTSRTTLLEVGNRRDAHLNIERASDRFEGPPRPRSAIDIRPRSTIVERYIEREPLRDERSDRTSTVVYERDRDFGRESERDKPSERESPSELERQELKTGYYERPEPAPQPIVIRQRALEPQNIIINEAPAPPPIYLPQLPWEEGFQAIQRREEVQEVARLEPRRATEDEYYYRRDVREVRGPRRSNEDFALTAAAGPLAIAAYHERQEIRPRDSVSDRSYSDDEDVVIRRRIIKKERSRSRDSYHRRHLAEGALASAGAVALLANHRDKEGDVHRGRQVVGGVSLGALGAETLTRTRSRYRERHDDEDRSRSRSSSRHSHRKIKTGLALAAAAKYVSNRRETNAELGRGRSRTRSVSRRRYSSNNDFYDKDRGGMSRSRSRHADPKHRASQIAKAGAATASVAGIVEHFRNKSTKGDGSRSKSRVRTGAEIAAAGLAGAGVAGLYENRKAKEDREQELKARRERRRVRSISPSSDIGDPELGMVQYRTEPVYAYPSYYDLALATSGSAYVGKRNRSRNGRRRHSSESSSERYPRSKSRVRDIAGAAGTAAAAIGINQYKKRKEKKEAERDRDGYSRSRSRSRSASSIRSTLTKRLSNLIPRDSSHADAPTNFAGTRSPGAFPEGVLDSELTTRAGNLRILKYQDSSKAGGRQSVDEDLSRLDKDGQADSTRSATSAKNNEIDCPVLVDGKSLKLENEEASEPWFEPGSPAKVWERRSSSISIGNSFVLDEAEGDLGLTSLDGPSAEPTMEEAMKKEEVKKQDSQFLDSRMLHDRRPSPHRDDLLLGAGKKDTHSQPSPSMGGSAHLSESKIAQDLREDSGPPSQSSSMTDSTLLEDATDWEESDVEIFEHEFSPVGYSQSPGDMTNHSSLVQITLDPAKKEMVERLMQEVWTIFNEKWPTAARECAGAPNDYSSTSRPASGSISQAGNHSGGNSSGFQRSDNREDGKSNENPEKGLGGNGKQPESPSDANQTSLGFACPYRKRDPRKYCVRDWRSCALSPQKTVARVKAHLYRYHIIHQCQRCKSLFKSDQELDSHIETSERCDAIVALPVDGITRKMKALLQCKRKAFPGQTEAERWKQIYQTLFPMDEEVPEPYFEPIRDNEESTPISPDFSNLTNYEDFLRRVLPRFVRSALEAEVNNEMQPIEERLRGQLLEVIEQAQNRAFNEYRTMMDTNHSAEPSVDSGYLSTHSRPGPSRNSKGKGPANSFPADSLILSEADSNDIHRSPEMLSSPFMGRDSIASFESMSPTQQSFASMSSPEHLQFQGAMSHEIIPPEGLFSSDPSLLDYPPGDLIANMMDMDSLSWDFPLPENSSSNYTI